MIETITIGQEKELLYVLERWKRKYKYNFHNDSITFGIAVEELKETLMEVFFNK